jgi:hypothetical protein
MKKKEVFNFVEWLGSHYVRFRSFSKSYWVEKSHSQTDPLNEKSTKQLYKFWKENNYIKEEK